MPLFEFTLKDIADVELWGEEGQKNLHWFALIDGFFTVNAGDRRLFALTPEMTALRGNANGKAAQACDVDYQVARLHTDMLTILADALQPIPEDIFQYVEDQKKQDDLYAKLDVCWESDDGSIVAPLAADWLDARKLDTEYLHDGPDIWFLNTGDHINVRWRTEGKEEQDVKVWAAGNGEIELGANSFLEEVILFHQSLMEQMAARIELIKKNGPPAGVFVDMALLEQEHFERQGQLETALASKIVTNNWQAVAGALARVWKIIV